MKQVEEIDVGNGGDGWNLQRIQRDIDAMQEQIRVLNQQQQETIEAIADQAKDVDEKTFQNVAPMINQIDNGDFVFNQTQSIPGTVYVGSDDDLGNWYFKSLFIGGVTSFTEHTTTVRSADGVRANPGFMFDPTVWEKSDGVVGTRGGVWGTPLPKNIAFPGTSLYVRLQAKRNSGFTFPPTWRLLASIFDNTPGINDFVSGTPFNLTATPAFASPGAFSRQYILRVDTPTTFFYSEVVSPATVNNQVSVNSIDLVNYVNVSWQVFQQALRYRLYRFDSQNAVWHLIADIVNGATSFRDVGGVTGDLFSPPGFNFTQQAHATFVNFGDYINSSNEFQDVVFNILVPETYDYGATTGKQWLVFYIVDEDLVGQSLSNPDAIFIDKVALSYTNGRFTYSARDLDLQAATIQATTPPPVPPPGGNEGDGGGPPPVSGGGSSGRPISSCVLPDTDILMSNLTSKKASEVKIFDRVINIKGKKSMVVSIIKGTTDKIYTIVTKGGNELKCSPTHRVMTFQGGDLGVEVSKLNIGDELWVRNDKNETRIETVTSIEIEDVENREVMTFRLLGEHTYVSNGIVSHNLKPLFD